MVVDSPHFAQKYVRRMSKDCSTVRRFSTTPVENIADSPLSHRPSVRGIRTRRHARKRSSISSTLSKVLILNVRDLLRATNPGDNDEVCCCYNLNFPDEDCRQMGIVNIPINVRLLNVVCLSVLSS